MASNSLKKYFLKIRNTRTKAAEKVGGHCCTPNSHWLSLLPYQIGLDEQIIFLNYSQFFSLFAELSFYVHSIFSQHGKSISIKSISIKKHMFSQLQAFLLLFFKSTPYRAAAAGLSYLKFFHELMLASLTIASSVKLR